MSLENLEVIADIIDASSRAVLLANVSVVNERGDLKLIDSAPDVLSRIIGSRE